MPELIAQRVNAYLSVYECALQLLSGCCVICFQLLNKHSALRVGL